MQIKIKRPMVLLFLCFFFGIQALKPLILKPYERERKPFLILYENKEKYCTVLGTVTDISEGDDGAVLVLKECTLTGFDENVTRECGGVRLYVDRELGESAFCGMRVRAYGSIKVFTGAGNPGQFDSYEYYRRQHIYANVYALKAFHVGGKKNVLRDAMVSMKRRLKSSVVELYPKGEAGVLFAMLTGDKSILESETSDDFRKSGISHILAVSGLHISFLCMGFNRLLRKLTVKKRVRDTLTVAFALVFVLFTGAGISAVRAGLMCACALLAENTGRKNDLLSSLCFAGCVELVIYPLEGTSSAFLLSYTAILGVYAAGITQAGMLSGLVITLFTLPVTLFFFFEFSTYGVIASMLVIPVTTITLGLGLVSAVVGMISIGLGTWMAGAAFLSIRWIEGVSRAAQVLPFSRILTGRPGRVGIILYYACLVLVVKMIEKYREETEGVKPAYIKAALKNMLKWALPVAAVGTFALIIKAPNSNVAFLSVGQGDSIVYHDRVTVVFDCGSSSDTDVGKNVLTPYLKLNGVGLIDTVVVSHMDGDHVNGITEILENMEKYRGDVDFYRTYKGNVGIKRLVLPKVAVESLDYAEMVSLAEKKGVEVVYMEAGGEMILPRGRIRCLAPIDAAESDNDTSLVMLLATRDKAYLMTGDAGVEEEARMIAMWPMGLRGIVRDMGYTPREYILKVGHHGSRTSTSIELLKWGDFDTAVISVGHMNTYGHPKQEVLDRLKEEGIEVHRTDEEGAVSVGTVLFDTFLFK